MGITLRVETPKPQTLNQRASGLGFRVWGLGFGVWGLGFRV